MNENIKVYIFVQQRNIVHVKLLDIIINVFYSKVDVKNTRCIGS